MDTVTAKEFRDNMEKIIKRVERGEPIRLTYRSRTTIMLRPEPKPHNGVDPGSPEAMRQFFVAGRAMFGGADFSHINAAKSAKEIYHDLLDHHPKYAKYARCAAKIEKGDESLSGRKHPA